MTNQTTSQEVRNLKNVIKKLKQDLEKLDKAKIEEERQKNRIERRKLAFEIAKYKREGWLGFLTTPLSIFIPLLIAALAFAGGVYSEIKQTNRANELANREFKLKAMEMIFTTKNPQSAKNKAKLLVELYPDDFPPDFSTDFNPAKYAQLDSEVLLEITRLVAEHPTEQDRIIRLWYYLLHGREIELLNKNEQEISSANNSSEIPPTPPSNPCSGSRIAICTWGEILELFRTNPEMLLENPDFQAFLLEVNMYYQSNGITIDDFTTPLPTP